jgi:hypothetical protein
MLRSSYLSEPSAIFADRATGRPGASALAGNDTAPAEGKTGLGRVKADVGRISGYS